MSVVISIHLTSVCSVALRCSVISEHSLCLELGAEGHHAFFHCRTHQDKLLSEGLWNWDSGVLIELLLLFSNFPGMHMLGFFSVALNNLFAHIWLPWYHPSIVPKDWVQDSLVHSLAFEKRHSFLPTPQLQQQSGIISVWWSFVSRPPSLVLWNWNSFACKAPRIWQLTSWTFLNCNSKESKSISSASYSNSIC